MKALHHLCCEIWTTCDWPDEWKIKEFVMLYKAESSTECGNYRTIYLISHASKVLLIIILNRMRKKAEEELSDIAKQATDLTEALHTCCLFFK